MKKLADLEAKVSQLENYMKSLGLDKAMKGGPKKQNVRLLKQKQSVYGVYSALCIDTLDVYKQNRIRFFSPQLHDPNSPYKSLPFAYPISTLGGFDDSGSSWVPPAGSTVMLVFEAGNRSVGYYLGTTWSRDRGPDGQHKFPIPIPEPTQSESPSPEPIIEPVPVVTPSVTPEPEPTPIPSESVEEVVEVEPDPSPTPIEAPTPEIVPEETPEPEPTIAIAAPVSDTEQFLEEVSIQLPTYLENVPGIVQIAAAAEAIMAIGSDMTPEEREESQGVVVAAVIVGQLAQVRRLK